MLCWRSHRSAAHLHCRTASCPAPTSPRLWPGTIAWTRPVVTKYFKEVFFVGSLVCFSPWPTLKWSFKKVQASIFPYCGPEQQGVCVPERGASAHALDPPLRQPVKQQQQEASCAHSTQTYQQGFPQAVLVAPHLLHTHTSTYLIWRPQRNTSRTLWRCWCSEGVLEMFVCLLSLFNLVNTLRRASFTVQTREQSKTKMNVQINTIKCNESISLLF